MRWLAKEQGMKSMAFFVVAALVLVPAGGGPAEVPTGPARAGRPTASIADGAHGGGNAHFFFLPPLVPEPSFNGTFDPTLAPFLMVDVCRMNGGTCVIPSIITFTASADPASATGE